MRTDQFTLGQGDEGESNGFIQTQRRRLSHSEGIINEPRRGPVSLEDEEIREGTEAPSNKQSCPAIEQEVSGVSALLAGIFREQLAAHLSGVWTEVLYSPS